MPDLRPHPPAELKDTPALRQRRRHARRIVMGLALLLWAMAIYAAIMFRIGYDVHHPLSDAVPGATTR